jgi:hypothetical protein
LGTRSLVWLELLRLATGACGHGIFDASALHYRLFNYVVCCAMLSRRMNVLLRIVGTCNCGREVSNCMIDHITSPGSTELSLLPKSRFCVIQERLRRLQTGFNMQSAKPRGLSKYPACTDRPLREPSLIRMRHDSCPIMVSRISQVTYHRYLNFLSPAANVFPVEQQSIALFFPF